MRGGNYMSSFFDTLSQIWALLFGWMPSSLAIICTLIIAILVIILIIKIVAFILDAIPFL